MAWQLVIALAVALPVGLVLTTLVRFQQTTGVLRLFWGRRQGSARSNDARGS